MLCGRNTVPLNWSQVIESPRNGGDRGLQGLSRKCPAVQHEQWGICCWIFFWQPSYFSHLTCIKPGSTWFSLMVLWWSKKYSPAQKGISKIYGLYLRSLEIVNEKANILHTVPFVNSPFSSVHFTHISDICPRAPLSTVLPRLLPNWAPRLGLCSSLLPSIFFLSLDCVY